MTAHTRHQARTKVTVRITVHYTKLQNELFETSDQQQLTTYLDSQLGRPYAVQHHLSGQRCDGLHCAEYATDALMSVQLIRAERPPRVSPATLRTGVTQHAIYAVGTTLRLTPPPTPPRRNESLCERWWHDTQSCCSNCCRRLRGWFLCQ